MKGYIISHKQTKATMCYLGETLPAGNVAMFGLSNQRAMVIVFRTKKIAKRSLNAWCSWNVGIFPGHFNIEKV